VRLLTSSIYKHVTCTIAVALPALGCRGFWGTEVPQWGPGAEPLVGGSAGEPLPPESS